VFDIDHQAKTLKLQLYTHFFFFTFTSFLILFPFYSPDGTYFDVTTDDVLYDTNPKKGDVVTFSFESFSRSPIPVRPKIFRIRTDVLWEDIVRTDIKDSSKARSGTNHKKTKIKKCNEKRECSGGTRMRRKVRNALR
jgi:hypothetical protein